MPSTNPRLPQWQARHRQALAAVKAAEASGDPQAVRSAYATLREVNVAKPDGQAAPPKPKKGPVRRGVLSTVTETLRGALPK